MTEISPYADFGLQTAATPATASGDLAQEDFLTLMIAQFKNQDPFEPLDNGDFLGQLAQFSTVSGIDSLNDSFAGLAESIQGEQALQAASLVGRSVLADTNVAWLGASDVSGAIELPASAGDVQIDVRDSSGQLIRSLNLGQQPPGTVRFSWDGRDNGGDAMPDGNYFIDARAVRGTQVESVAPMIEAQIDSVTLGRNGQGMTLNLQGGNTLSLSQVRQII